MNEKFDPSQLISNPFVAGLVGGLLALRGVPGDTLKERAFTAISACLLAGFLSPAVSEYFGLDSESMRSAVSFLIGLFGLNLVSAGFEYLKVLNLADLVPWGKKK